MARSKYMLGAKDMKDLEKPLKLADVERKAMEKFGSLEGLETERKRKAEERESKKRKREAEKEAATKAADDHFRSRLAYLREGLVSRDCPADVLDWLLQTPEAVTFGRNKTVTDPQQLQDQATIISDQLMGFEREAKQRRAALHDTIKRRLIDHERQTLGETWNMHSISVDLPAKDPTGLCVRLEPRVAEPCGTFITGFVNNQNGDVGPLEATGKVDAGDVICQVEIEGVQPACGGSWQNVMFGLSMAHQNCQAKPPGSHVRIKLVVAHFNQASPEELAAAQKKALEPHRLEKVRAPLSPRLALKCSSQVTLPGLCLPAG